MLSWTYTDAFFTGNIGGFFSFLWWWTGHLCSLMYQLTSDSEPDPSFGGNFGGKVDLFALTPLWLSLQLCNILLLISSSFLNSLYLSCAVFKSAESLTSASLAKVRKRGMHLDTQFQTQNISTHKESAGGLQRSPGQTCWTQWTGRGQNMSCPEFPKPVDKRSIITQAYIIS